jgi:hypothetical protein
MYLSDYKAGIDPAKVAKTKENERHFSNFISNLGEKGNDTVHCLFE